MRHSSARRYDTLCYLKFVALISCGYLRVSGLEEATHRAQRSASKTLRFNILRRVLLFSSFLAFLNLPHLKKLNYANPSIFSFPKLPDFEIIKRHDRRLYVHESARVSRDNCQGPQIGGKLRQRGGVTRCKVGSQGHVGPSPKPSTSKLTVEDPVAGRNCRIDNCLKFESLEAERDGSVPREKPIAYNAAEFRTLPFFPTEL